VNERNRRQLESDIQTDLKDRLTYGGYLALDKLLEAQSPLSHPPHHDEMLFIIQHQVSELWMKLIIHELQAAMAAIRADDLSPALKVLARVKQVQKQLFEMWGVLSTLTPSEYAEFRDVLGPASGFQSAQYRQIEFLLGNKNADYLKVFAHDVELHQAVEKALIEPSLYDEFLCFLARAGHPVPKACVQRDWSEPYEENPDLLPVLQVIYEQRENHWDAYQTCEQLIDIEEWFQMWRFRHMKTVERIIGHKPGTGGSSGVGFLKQALSLTFFPELLAVRTQIGA
jgi:tryptophan 2,3-dioxygenase